MAECSRRACSRPSLQRLDQRHNRRLLAVRRAGGFAGAARNAQGVFDPIDLPRAFAEKERDIILREYEFRMVDNPDAQAAAR